MLIVHKKSKEDKAVIADLTKSIDEQRQQLMLIQSEMKNMEERTQGSSSLHKKMNDLVHLTLKYIGTRSAHRDDKIR